MKRLRGLLCVAAAAALLVSCAGMPGPSSTGSSLVVGNLVADFPDGYFSRTPQRLESRIQVKLTDITSNRNFKVSTTDGGFYYFTATPGDTYRIDSWEYYEQIARTRYRLSPFPIQMQFEVPADRVVYTGHLLYTFTDPDKTEVYKKRNSYNYKTDVTISDRPGTVKDFISKKQPDSGWLKYDIVEAKLTKAEGN